MSRREECLKDRRNLPPQQANQQHVAYHARAQAKQENVAEVEMQDTANEHDWITNIGEPGGGQAPATVAFGPSPRLASPAFALHAGQDRLGTQQAQPIV